jgi:hypothetical protein
MFSVDRKVFPLTGKCFSLTGKCFPLTNFPNGKQTQESLESSFPESEFRETNMALEAKEKVSSRARVLLFFHYKYTIQLPKCSWIKLVFVLGQEVLISFPFDFFVIIKFDY